MPPTLVVELSFKGQSVVFSSDVFQIQLDLSGPEAAEPLSACSALWLSLPFAMKLGRDLHIKGTIDPIALDNAQRISRIWPIWHPGFFHPIDITADRVETPAVPAMRQGTLMLFSGGLDSSHALCHEFLSKGLKVDALTIHGMDYRRWDTARFEALMTKTAPLRAQAINRHYFIASNAAQQMQHHGIPASVGHGFHLFGCLFLFERHYQHGAIAADSPVPIDYVMPWGTNAYINSHYQSQAFHIRTLCNDIDRPAKTRALAAEPSALKSLTFCKQYELRPENCGRCEKCLRTKAGFDFELGFIPPIYLDNSYDFQDILGLNMRSQESRLPILDLMMSAHRNGRMAEYLELAQALRKYDTILSPPARGRWKKRFNRLRKQARHYLAAVRINRLRKRRQIPMQGEQDRTVH